MWHNIIDAILLILLGGFLHGLYLFFFTDWETYKTCEQQRKCRTRQ